jgi:hypothetical protein
VTATLTPPHPARSSAIWHHVHVGTKGNAMALTSVGLIIVPQHIGGERRQPHRTGDMAHNLQRNLGERQKVAKPLDGFERQ